ncbi:phosphatidylethanolamine-binding protein [Crucibulum laeve]|uniref:Phosphatidylethanolamine-binding protein n=1 Tax=Crucibulum laeve TaxID=68775 RepID=A0A5C3LZT6_9AGAR|nr:phosphatidylethanolamine-binding protein [Crucibulum laeve]
MFALRRLPTGTPRILVPTAPRWNRGNASVLSEPVADTPAPPPYKPLASEVAGTESTGKAASSVPTTEAAQTISTTQGRRRTPLSKGTPRSRPNISNAQPRKWNRPVAEGVIPAYDLALKLIKEDSAEIKNQIVDLRGVIQQREIAANKLRTKLQGLDESSEAIVEAKQEVKNADEELEELREKLNILEVQSEINLPQVRWRRHLLEQKWRKDGNLDLLMERVYQMKVVPDVLPQLHPTVDLRITTPTLPTEFHKTQKPFTEVEPGTYLQPIQTIKPPKLYANVFHADTRLYTMLLIDADVVDEENESFTTYLHWLKPNIPLSATTTSRITDLNTHTLYIPPHPPKGTPYHRYVLLLLPQPPLGAPTYSLNAAARTKSGESTSLHLDIPVITEKERLGFDVRSFTRRWGLDGVKGGGAHMWREVWDEKVSKIYEDILKIPEPRYGRAPKVDPYLAYKDSKKYVS